MSALPPEQVRRPAARTPAGPRVPTGARPGAFDTSRAPFVVPPLPAARAKEQTPGQRLASLLRRTRRAPAKAMIDIGDAHKDSPATWTEFHDKLAAKERTLLAAAAADERAGNTLPVGPELTAAAEGPAGDITFSEAAGLKEGRGRIVGPLAFALGRTEVRAGARRSERAGLLEWANPPTAEELAAPAETRLRGPVPDTAEMSTAFGGSSGRGIFVLTQGRLHVTDTAKYAEMFGGGGIEAYHSSITGGRPVDAAGEIEIRDGRVVTISNLSGHYRPGPEHLVNTLSWLAGRGIDVSGVTVGVLDKEYDATRFIEAGGDVAALEADGLSARGVALSRDPTTGRTVASVAHPTKGVLRNLSVAAQQRILAEPAGPLSLEVLTSVEQGEADARAMETAGPGPEAPAAGTTKAQPTGLTPEDFSQRRTTVSNLLHGRRRPRVAPIRDRFAERS